MGITVIGRRMQVSDSLREYVQDKIGASMKVMDISPLDAEVVVYREQNPSNPRPAVCEVTLRTKGHIIRVEESEEDLHTAIDVAAAKVVRQLRKYKTRVIDKKIRSNERAIGAEHAEAHPETNLDLDRLMDELSNDEIVRTKEIDLAPMTEEEALVEIDLLGHDFFAYIDRDSNRFCVLYRREGGGYGLLMQKED